MTARAGFLKLTNNSSCVTVKVGLRGAARDRRVTPRRVSKAHSIKHVGPGRSSSARCGNAVIRRREARSGAGRSPCSASDFCWSWGAGTRPDPGIPAERAGRVFLALGPAPAHARSLPPSLSRIRRKKIFRKKKGRRGRRRNDSGRSRLQGSWRGPPPPPRRTPIGPSEGA